MSYIVVDDHADLLGLSDRVNPVGLPPEAAIHRTPARTPALVLVGERGVAGWFRLSVSPCASGPARACERPGQASGTAGPGTS